MLISFMSILGITYFLLGIIYFFAAIIVANRSTNRLTSSASRLFIAQAVIVPIVFLSCSIILVLNGWRLDPLLQFQQLILFVLIAYLVAKDIVSR